MTQDGLFSAKMAKRKWPTRTNTTETTNGKKTDSSKYVENDASGKMTKSDEYPEWRRPNLRILPQCRQLWRRRPTTIWPSRTNMWAMSWQMLPENGAGQWINSTLMWGPVPTIGNDQHGQRDITNVSRYRRKIIKTKAPTRKIKKRVRYCRSRDGSSPRR